MNDENEVSKELVKYRLEQALTGQRNIESKLHKMELSIANINNLCKEIDDIKLSIIEIEKTVYEVKTIETKIDNLIKEDIKKINKFIEEFTDIYSLKQFAVKMKQLEDIIANRYMIWGGFVVLQFLFVLAMYLIKLWGK